MIYIERRVRSAPGLSQEDALESLQSHSNFRPGTKIASIRRRGERWVADLLVPKTAGEFPPSDDGGGEEESSPKAEKSEGEEPDADGDFDGPPVDGLEGPPKADEGEKKPGKGGTEEEILHVLTEILHALKGGPVGPGLGGPDDLGPGPDALGGPPPHGGPGAPGGAKPPSKLGPGEVLPHQTPIGAPAFSSTNPLYQRLDPLYQRLAKVAGRQRHIPVSSPVGMSIKEAQTQLAPYAAHFGYRVAQIKYCGTGCTCKTPGSSKIHALLEAA